MFVKARTWMRYHVTDMNRPTAETARPNVVDGGFSLVKRATTSRPFAAQNIPKMLHRT